MSDFRVIVCGSRGEDVGYVQLLKALLVGLAERYGNRLVVIHGAARGIDETAGGLARMLGIKVEEYPAGWEKHGRAAGHIRNQAMLELGADLVIACKSQFNWRLDRGGTEDMVRRARNADVSTYVIESAREQP